MITRPLTRPLTRSLVGGVRSGGVDPLLNIEGLSFWDRRSGIFQESTAINESVEGSPVGAWVDRLTNKTLSQENLSIRFTLTSGWVSSNNNNNLLTFFRTRTSQYSWIFRIKLTTIQDETRYTGLNTTFAGIHQNTLRVLNEAVSWSQEPSIAPVLNQVYTIRIIRTTANDAQIWINGIARGTLNGVSQASDDGLFLLRAGAFSGIALVDRVLSDEEIVTIEDELIKLDP